MSTSRPFAYNPTLQTEGVLIQYGDLAVGIPDIAYGDSPGGLKWWEGPDEDLGYCIGTSLPTGGILAPDGIYGDVTFWRTDTFSDAEFLELANTITGQNFLSTAQAVSWLNSNGYWTSYGGSPSPSASVTPTQTPTPTPTPTNTSTPGVPPSQTPTNTSTPTQTPTNTSSPGVPPSQTPTNTSTPTQTPTQTPTKTPTQTPTQTPTTSPNGGTLTVWAKYVNTGDELGYTLNGGPYLGIGEVTTTDCTFIVNLTGLANGDQIIFKTLTEKAISGSTTDCPSVASGCTYVYNFTGSGSNFVYITIDGSNAC